jgi:ribonuclease HI
MEIYIDGSCRPSTKLGGYGVLIVNPHGIKKIITGKQENVTNNMMELQALIAALTYIQEFTKSNKKSYNFQIYSDSQYVVKGINEWWNMWKLNGYKTSSGPVKNLDLWKKIDDLMQNIKFSVTWVKGHSSNVRHNEIDKIVFDITDEKNNKIKPDNNLNSTYNIEKL